MPPEPPPPTSDSPPRSLRARKLPLPDPLPSPISSVLSCAPSLSLALLLADSSALLFPYLPHSSTPVAIPPPVSAAAFARAASSSASFPSTLFFAADAGGKCGVFLRAYSISSAASSAGVAVPLSFKRHRAAASVSLEGMACGPGVRLAGTTNVLALHSLGLEEIWLLGLRAVEGGVELHKCAVIKLDAARPVYSMTFAAGRLVLAERGGVRAFPLRSIMKGKAGRERQPAVKPSAVVADIEKEGRRKKNGLLNGLVLLKDRANEKDRGGSDGKSASCKLTTLRFKQDSGEHSSSFFSLSCVEEQKASKEAVHVLSVYTLAKETLLALDSSGDLHVISLPDMSLKLETTTSQGSCTNFATRRLAFEMKVRSLAVLPNSKEKTQILWVSDCQYMVHAISAVHPDSSTCENSEIERKPADIELSVLEAIFVPEKVQDIVPLSANEVLILGQGSVFSYGFT